MYFMVRSFCFFLLFSVVLNLFLLNGKNFFQYVTIVFSNLNNYRTTLIFLISPFLLALGFSYACRKIRPLTLGAFLFGGTLVLYGGLFIISF